MTEWSLTLPRATEAPETTEATDAIDAPEATGHKGASKRLCVFCGSNAGTRPAYAAAARELAALMAQSGIGLVYGGGHSGLMGVVADAALANGAEVIGVITEQLTVLERAHSGLTSLQVVPTMHERKATMAALSDGFVALPGGFGTLEEVCEMITWTQLAIHRKPVALVNVDGYFDPLLAQFDRAVDDGLLRIENRRLVISAATSAEALERIAAWTPPDSDKWFDPPHP